MIGLNWDEKLQVERFQETASPDVGVGWGNELDIRPDKCETAAVPLGISLYPYHGHHQTEIKHLSGHTFTLPRHWSLGTGHIRLMAPSIVLSPAAAASAQNAAKSL